MPRKLMLRKNIAYYYNSEDDSYKSAALLLTADMNLILSVREGKVGDKENAKVINIRVINIRLTDASIFNLECAILDYKRKRGELWND